MSLCMGCMDEKADSAVCPCCGYAESAQTENSVYLKPGTVLNNRFIIGRVIRHSGSGITYIGYDDTLKQKIAVKEYYPFNYVQRNPGDTLFIPCSESTREYYEYGKSKFVEEARNLAKFFDLPGIVWIRDCIEANGTAYIIMQFPDGMTLKDFLKQNNGVLPYKNAINILLPVMDGLRRIHKAGIIHRDIRPDNIIITKDFQGKLIDFGAARQALDEDPDPPIIRSAVPKFEYMPMEKCMKKGKQGPWTDVYALCATLYRMITGEVPPDFWERIINDTLVIPDNLPENVKFALKKGLAVHASERFGKIDDLQNILLNNQYET